MPLPRRFYLRAAPAVAQDLLGCLLISRRGRTVTAGRIVETEAYLGPEDEASHAAFRPWSHHLFYGEGGIAYVFPAYGLHACLNAITGRATSPAPAKTMAGQRSRTASSTKVARSPAESRSRPVWSSRCTTGIRSSPPRA